MTFHPIIWAILLMQVAGVYSGSARLANAPLGTDDDGRVRWVARALDPRAQEVTTDGAPYWYFNAAPTIEIRVFRDTKQPVELTSFQILDASNVVTGDTGERIGAPIQLSKSTAFEVWPDDPGRPLAFRFEATYRWKEGTRSFTGHVEIPAVHPKGVGRHSSLERVPVAHALKTARSGASFTDQSARVDRSFEERKQKAEARVAREQQARRAELADSDRKRQQDREERRIQDRQQAEARQRAQEAEVRRMEQEAQRNREFNEEMLRMQREADQQRARDAEEQVRRQREQQERQARDAERAERQREAERARREDAAAQQRAQQAKREEAAPERTMKMSGLHLGGGDRVMMTPDYAEPKKVPKTEEFQQGSFGIACPEGYELLTYCPTDKHPGIKCFLGKTCRKIGDDVNQAAANKQNLDGTLEAATRGDTSGTASGSNTSPASSGNPSADSAGPSSDEHLAACPGPADHRRRPGSCVRVVETRRGDYCGDRSSIRVQVENVCAERIYLRLCLEKSSGEFDCAPRGVKSGEKTASWTCDATGKYTVDAVFSPQGKDWVCADWH